MGRWNGLTRALGIAWLVAAAGLAGCPKHAGGPDIGPASLSGGARDTFGLLEAAGDRAILVLVLRPDRWSAAMETLRPWLARLPVPPKLADQILSAPDMLTALSKWMEMAEGQAGWPRELAGWDRSRPVVAALFEPGRSRSSLASKLTGTGSLPGLPGMRHRVLIPATDPRALLASMQGFMKDLSIQPEDRAKDFPGLKGGLLFPFPDLEGFLALIPEKRRVRVELVTHQLHGLRPEPGGDGQASVLAGWRELLDQDPRAESLPFTPAMHFAATSDDLILAYLRPWMFRETSNLLGTRMVIEAVAHADPAMRAMLMAMGFAEVNTGTLLMSPRGAEMDDLALGLSADGVLRFRGVASLTGLGARMYRAGFGGAVSPVHQTDLPALLRGSLRLDLNALLDHAHSPDFFSGIESPREFVEPIRECGYFCSLHALLRNPVGMLRVLRSFARYDYVEHLPLAADFALVDLNPAHPGQPVKAAAALTMPAGFNPGWLKQALAVLEEERHTGGKLKVQVVEKTSGDQKIILIGFNLNPQKAFTAGPKPVAAESISRFSVDLTALSKNFAAIHPGAGQVLNLLAEVEGQTRLSGRALLGEFSLGAAGKEPGQGAARPGFADYADFSWDSPGLAESQSKGAGCLSRLVAGQIQAFKAIAAVSARYKTSLLAQALEETEADLDCALAEPGTRKAAGDIHLMAVFLLDVMHQGQFQRKQHLAVLSRACHKGLAFACRREKQVRARPVLDLVEVPSTCRTAPGFGADRVVVPASPDAAPEVRLPRYRRPVGLIVEKGVAWSRVARTLSKIDKHKVDHLEVLVRDAGKKPSSLPAWLPGAGEAALGEIEKPQSWAWLKLSGSRIEIGYGTRKKVIDFEGEFVDPDRLRRVLDELLEHTKPGRLYLDADPQASFAGLAGVLSALTCPAGGPQDSSPPVYLGPAPALPEPGEQAAVMEHLSQGSLDMPIIRRVIRRRIGRIKYCYEKQLLKQPDLAGTIRVRFVIGKDGKVAKAEAVEDSMKKPAVTSCLLRSIRGMEFPKPRGGRVVVNYPFHFKTSK